MTRKVLNPVTLATAVVIIYSVMPVLSVFISSYITTYAYMLLVVFLLGFIVLSGGFRRINSLIYVVLPFLIYIGCTYFTKTNSLVLWGYQSMIFLMPVIIGYYYVNYRPENISLFAKILIVAILITAITTIIGLIQFPGAARILATIAESDDSAAVEYWWHNIGGYYFVYTVVLSYPLVIYSYKQKKISLLIALVLTSTVFIVVIASEYATALLFILLTSLLYLTKRELTPKNILVLAIIGFIFILLFSSFFSYLLESVANMFKSDTIRERLLALAGGKDALETFDDKRIWLYRNNINLFLNNPLFGTMFDTGEGTAGHSQMLITLAQHGILGGFTVFFIYRNIYRLFFSPFRNVPGYGYYFLIFVESIILSSINTGFFFIILTLFAPILFYHISGSAKQNYDWIDNNLKEIEQ